MQGLSESPVLIALVSSVCGVIGTYLTVRYKNSTKTLPTDAQRKGVIYDGYENLIKGQQDEIDRKTKLVSHLETLVDKLEDDLRDTRDLLEQTKNELTASKEQNKIMQRQLEDLRRSQ